MISFVFLYSYIESDGIGIWRSYYKLCGRINGFVYVYLLNNLSIKITFLSSLFKNIVGPLHEILLFFSNVFAL